VVAGDGWNTDPIPRLIAGAAVVTTAQVTPAIPAMPIDCKVES